MTISFQSKTFDRSKHRAINARRNLTGQPVRTCQVIKSILWSNRSMASSVTMKNKFTLKCKFYKYFWFLGKKIILVVNNSYCHIKVSQVVMKQRGVFWSHALIQCDIELMSPVWKSTIKKRPRWPWPLPEIIWPKSASMAKLIIILLEVKFFYKGFKLSCSGLTEISTFLERVLTEHRDSRVTSDSKLNKLLISSICSIRFLYRNWDVFDKPLQLSETRRLP